MNALTDANVVTIPVNSAFPWSSFPITLSGIMVTLSLRYNTRMQRWVLDIGDAQNAPILRGLPLLIDRNPSGRFTYAPGALPGFFFVTPNDGSQNQPTRYSWGQTHTLYYFDPTGPA